MDDVRDGAELRRKLGYLSEAEVAAVVGVEVKTLKNWRAAKDGPPYSQAGGSTLYRIDSVTKWLASREVRPGAK